MNSDFILTKLKSYKKDARTFTDTVKTPNYKIALFNLKKAVELLEDSENILSESDYDKWYADLYGTIGGIYARQNDFTNALKYYSLGETKEDIQNSTYNYLNKTIYSIILSPNNFCSHKSDIDKIYKILDLKDKKREYMGWWDFADLGLTSLLLGKTDTAKDKYGDFFNAHPKPENVESVIRVLKHLNSAITESEAELSLQMDDVIRYIENRRELF